MAMQLSTDDVKEIKGSVDALRDEVRRVFIGSSDVIDPLMVAMLARGHVLLEGVPGVAKTTLAKAFAHALGVSVNRIQFTPDLLPADITGTYVLSPKDGTFSFRHGPVFANLVLADEINRAPPKTQAALLEAMQEHQVTAEGETMSLPDPFMVIATQNPVDLEGTYPLPEAQIDRFLLHLDVGYPEISGEVAMIKAHHAAAIEARAVIDADAVRQMQDITRQVFVEDDLYEYAVGLSHFTRHDSRVMLGASPRASLSLVQAAKAAAVLAGRAYVSPDDIKGLARPVLAHRLVLFDEAEGDGDAREAVVDTAVERVSYRKAVRPA